MKVEIEEVLKIIEKKQLFINNKLLDILPNSSYRKSPKFPVIDREENLRDCGYKLYKIRELTAAFAALGDVYASLLALSMCEADLEAESWEDRKKKKKINLSPLWLWKICFCPFQS